MADNTRTDLATTDGDLIASEDIAGVKYQRFKLMDSTPARGPSVMTPPENVWVVMAPNATTLVQPERTLAIVHKRKLR